MPLDNFFVLSIIIITLNAISKTIYHLGSTINPNESYFGKSEALRRCRVAGALPNEGAVLSPAVARPMDTNEKWPTDRKYLSKEEG